MVCAIFRGKLRQVIYRCVHSATQVLGAAPGMVGSLVPVVVDSLVGLTRKSFLYALRVISDLKFLFPFIKYKFLDCILNHVLFMPLQIRFLIFFHFSFFNILQKKYLHLL